MNERAFYTDDCVFDELEEEVGTCRCPDCKEGAVLVRVTNTRDHSVEFYSNCCYAVVDPAYTDYPWSK